MLLATTLKGGRAAAVRATWGVGTGLLLGGPRPPDSPLLYYAAAQWATRSSAWFALPTCWCSPESLCWPLGGRYPTLRVAVESVERILQNHLNTNGAGKCTPGLETAGTEFERQHSVGGPVDAEHFAHRARTRTWRDRHARARLSTSAHRNVLAELCGG